MANIAIGAPALISFAFQSSASVRIVTIDGEPWFVAKDIAAVLGYSNTKQAVIDHCKRAKSLKDIGVANRDPQQNQELDPQTKLIPEPDVYRLITRSKLPSAEAFESWLFETVLPSIRKTGGYQMPAVAKPDYERCTNKQFQQLGQAINRAMAGWAFGSQHDQHVYNALRVVLSIDRIADLPSTDFDKALSVVGEIGKRNHAFLAWISEVLDLHFKEYAMLGAPWTPYLKREWKKQMRSALPARPNWLEIQKTLSLPTASPS